MERVTAHWLPATASSFLSKAKMLQGPVIRSIAVLPLANLSTDPEQEFLADGRSRKQRHVPAARQT
jgi:TolB-like protein